MPAAPMISSGRRPILSISAIATSVVRMLVTDVITVISSALLSLKPTERHSVVE